jgi:hypothetical protein
VIVNGGKSMGNYFKVFLDSDEEPLFCTENLEEARNELEDFGIYNDIIIKDRSGQVVWDSRITHEFY